VEDDVGGVRSERGVAEEEELVVVDAVAGAVVFPLRKKFTLNPGTTILEMQNRLRWL
jgi:hypothetical protein